MPKDFDMDGLFRAAMNSPLDALTEATPVAEHVTPKIEEFIDPNAGPWDKTEARRLLSLEENSLSLKPLGGSLQPKMSLPYSYNENNGVIVFTTDDGAYVIPSEIHTRSLLESAECRKDYDIVVPDLNDQKAWPEEQNEFFAKWKNLVEEHSTENWREER